MTKQRQQKPLLPLIIGGLLIVAIIGYGMFKKYGTGSDTEGNELKLLPSPTATIARNKPTQAATPQITTMPSMTPEATPTPSDILTPTPSPTVDPEKARLMGQQLKRALDDFLHDEAREVGGTAEKTKSYYEDIDGDGREDAAFLYSAFPREGNWYAGGLVVYRNDGDAYAYAGKVDFGGIFGFHIESLTIADHRIILRGKTPRDNDPDCCPSKPATLIYILRDNRLQPAK